jgi:hypothetical protein
MVITNGTFDTNLNGWAPTTGGNADVIWDNSGPIPGRMRLREYKCAQPCKVSQTFIIDSNTLSFDWQTGVDQWYENPAWKLTVGTTVVKDEGFSIGHMTGYSGTKSVDISSYIGQVATIELRIIPGSHCGSGDHGNTYLWVDNVMLSGGPNITATNMTVTLSESPCIEGTCAINVSATWQNQGDVDGSFVPSLTVDGTPITTPYPSEVLATGVNVTHTFSLTGMTKGQYSICPDPN